MPRWRRREGSRCRRRLRDRARRRIPPARGHPTWGSVTGLGCRHTLPNVELEGTQVDQAPNVVHTGKSVAHGDTSIGVRADDCRPLDAFHLLPDNLSVVMHVSEASRVGTGARKLHSADIDVLKFRDEGLPAPASVPGPVDEKKRRCSCRVLMTLCLPLPDGAADPAHYPVPNLPLFMVIFARCIRRCFECPWRSRYLCRRKEDKMSHRVSHGPTVSADCRPRYKPP
jgi:hypothetical protein